MPRRKFQPSKTYHPHAGTTPVRNVRPGEAIDDDGKPVRLQNYHLCGAEIFLGARDFDGAHWRTTYHSAKDSTEDTNTCPQCLDILLREDVTTDPPSEPEQ